MVQPLRKRLQLAKNYLVIVLQIAIQLAKNYLVIVLQIATLDVVVKVVGHKVPYQHQANMSGLQIVDILV